MLAQTVLNPRLDRCPPTYAPIRISVYNDCAVSHCEGNMASLNSALQQLRDEQKHAESQLEKLGAAISVLEDLTKRGGHRSSNRAAGGRRLSASARRRIAEAQRARWARVRAQKKSAKLGQGSSSNAAKRTLSAAARRKIAAAQRARWARVKGQQKKAA